MQSRNYPKYFIKNSFTYKAFTKQVYEIAAAKMQLVSDTFLIKNVLLF